MAQSRKLPAIMCETCGATSELFSTKTAAHYIGVSQGPVRAYAEAGQLPKRIVKGFIWTKGELEQARTRLNLDRTNLEVTRG